MNILKNIFLTVVFSYIALNIVSHMIISSYIPHINDRSALNAATLFVTINRLEFHNNIISYYGFGILGGHCDDTSSTKTSFGKTFSWYEKDLFGDYRANHSHDDLLIEFLKNRCNLSEEEWIYDIGNRAPFNETVEIILGKFEDIENRLSVAYKNKANLQAKYGKDFSPEKINADIQHLNNLGWQLVEPTKRFFVIAKQHMMKIDEANARAEAMQGLKTFTQEIEVAGNQPSEALEQSVADITTAIDNLEKAMNQ